MKLSRHIVYISFLTLLLFAGQASAGNTSKTNLTKAGAYYNSYNYAMAASYFEKYKTETTQPELPAMMKLADCYWQMRLYSKALETYSFIFPTTDSQDLDNQTKKRIAELYAREKNYDTAFQWLKDVPGYQTKAATYGNKNSISLMMKDSAAWKTNLININTAYREFSPAVFNSKLIFNSNRPLTAKTLAFGWDGNNFAHLWSVPMSKIENLTDSMLAADSTLLNGKSKLTSQKTAGVFEMGDTKPVTSLTSSLNDKYYLNGINSNATLIQGLNQLKYNVGSFSLDKNSNIYFSSNYKKAGKDGINRIQLLQGHLSDNQIDNIKALPFGDPGSFSVMHPAVNSKGNFLIFSSDKNKATSGYDLFYSEKDSVNQKWSEMKPLGSNVNSQGNEVFPTLVNDSVLYFSSDARGGLGGLDIYRISLNNAIRNISVPEHLSYPVNSSADDFGWAPADSAGNNGFFTSDRLHDDDNIFSFEYTPENQIFGKHYLRGVILDAASGKAIQNATVFVYNTENDSVQVFKTDSLGTYSFEIAKSSKYLIKAVEKSHSVNCMTQSFEIAETPNDTTININDLALAQYGIGYKWNNMIHYNFDKFNIRADARPILDSLFRIMSEYPINVELSSHTDSRGSYAYNDQLSQKRAEAAVAYLVKKGIDPSRITAKGYGERRLLNKCANGVKCSEADHQANRRTEFKITGLTQDAQAIAIDPDQYKAGDTISVTALPKGFFDHCK